MIAIARRVTALVLSVAFGGGLVALPSFSAVAAMPAPLYTLNLPDGRTASVYANGLTEIYSKDRKEIQFRRLQTGSNLHDVVPSAGLPDKAHLVAELMQPHPRQPFAPGQVIVVLRAGVSVPGDFAAGGPGNGSAGPIYTNDLQLNRALAALGTDRIERLFRHVNRSQLSAMSEAAQAAGGRPTLDIANVYRVEVTKSSVRNAVLELLKLPDVAYASPDWYVVPMRTQGVPVPAASLAEARQRAQRMQAQAFTAEPALKGGYFPANYALSSSWQSFHNAPNDDSAAAFDEIWTKYHQLPGEGETITDVSVGDVDDASAATNSADHCTFAVMQYGPTTEMIGGQRYINWPSMPLIPTYTSDGTGNLSGQGEVCNVDPFLSEVGLDFSMMAPLPHEDQRAGERGDGPTDLLGIAPGAKYRLVVPVPSADATLTPTGTVIPTYTDIQGAILAAALQTPRPDVITASLGYNFDSEGFSARFLEDDPLTESIVASIVNSYDIIVCISANDGILAVTNTAIGPSGGTVATDTALPGAPTTTLADIQSSGAPSYDYDSGSIDVGGTTLDDIFSDPPQYAKSAVLQAQHAFAETRFSGYGQFSSGDGTRVNVSAAADNVIAFEHSLGGADDGVYVLNEGGTSAAAPETAAAAAVLLQVARLAGHPFHQATDMRTFLEQTGTTVPGNGQADQTLDVGPQIDLRRAVETLIGKYGAKGTPAVHRVAVEQRRDAGGFDGIFQSDTDPTDIDLQSNSDANQVAWITIAPDWEWMPSGTTYELSLAAKPAAVLATTPWARMLPATILADAGLPLVSTSSRTVKFVYRALLGHRVLAKAPVSLTFTATGATTVGALAPEVPLVATGTTIPVKYDISHVDNVSNPELVVTFPGRFNPQYFSPFNVLTMPLSKLSGKVTIPVSSLHGGGIYGIGIELNPSTHTATDFNFIRVAPPQASTSRPLPPTLSADGSRYAHYLAIPYGTLFHVKWDVRNVPGATGAIVEISAPGPAGNGIYNPFNNPEGSIVDKDGVDSGSVYALPVSGASGTVQVNPKTAGLSATFEHTVRVIPTKAGVAAGEASDVSMITEGGLATSDGGSISGGFGINSNGADGYLTSENFSSSGLATSLQTVNTKTTSVTGVVGTQLTQCCSGPLLVYKTFGAGIYGSDIGLFDLYNEISNTNGYALLNPVAKGTAGATWTPPISSSFQLQGVAFNQSSTTAVFYGMVPPASSGPPTWQLFTSNLSTNTFSSVYDVSSAISSESSPQYQTIAENPTTNQAWLGSVDESTSCATPKLIDVDLATGNTSSFTGVGSGIPQSMALDPSTNVAAMSTLCDAGLGIYDLTKKTGTFVTLPGPGEPGYYLTVDPVHHLFLLAELYGKDAFTNCNTLSHLLVYDEKGNLVEDKEDFNWIGAQINPFLDGIQLIPKSRTGYTFSFNADELEPFTY